MVAEGGTEYGHTECLLRSKTPFGEYESCPYNPILTNRHLGGYIIQGAGHADIIEDKNGQWWMVNLGFRQIHQWRQFHHLGREVFLEPVYWQEDGWFKVGADGTSRHVFEVNENGCTYPDEPVLYPESRWDLDPKTACFIRCPDYENYRFDGNKVFLKGCDQKLSGKGNVTFAGDRQREFYCTAEININGETLGDMTRCGITAYMDENNHYDLSVIRAECGYKISGVINIGGVKLRSKEIKIQDSRIKLKIDAEPQLYKLLAFNGNAWDMLASMESKYLSSEVCEGFTGVVIGIFCEDESENPQFAEFEIKQI